MPDSRMESEGALYPCVHSGELVSGEAGQHAAGIEYLVRGKGNGDAASFRLAWDLWERWGILDSHLLGGATGEGVKNESLANSLKLYMCFLWSWEAQCSMV